MIRCGKVYYSRKPHGNVTLHLRQIRHSGGMKRVIVSALTALTLIGPASAGQISFDGNWREQGFLRLFSNDYTPRGNALDITSDGTVSLYWRAVPEALRGASNASWNWAVSQGVPATDLSKKGGDDRNIALYFVYTDAATAASLNPNRAAKLLRDANTKALVYVWGGTQKRGTTQQSPYHNGLKTLVRRAAGTGSHSERVDLDSDFKRAFGSEPGVLVGIGITADSDDTKTFIQAQVSNLALQ